MKSFHLWLSLTTTLVGLTKAQQYVKCLDAWSGLVDANSSCYQVANARAGSTSLSILFPQAGPSLNDTYTSRALRSITDAYTTAMDLYGTFTRTYLDIAITVGPPEPFYITELLGRTENGATGKCEVYINIIAFNQTMFAADQGQAVVAHELYHCLQYWRQPSLASRDNELFPSWLWRIEGSAAYMAASLYPDSNELAQGRFYDPSISVFNQQGRYTAALFLLGLNVTGIDNASIDEWLANFALLDSLEQERLQLATDSRAGIWFTEFIKSYVDGEVPGARIPLSFEVTDVQLTNGTSREGQNILATVQSFAAARHQVIIDPAETVLMSMTAPSGVTISYRQVGMPWTNWTLDDNGPSSILATPYRSCSGPDSSRLFDFLFVNTGTSQSANVTLTLERAPGAKPGSEICACLLERGNFGNCTGGFRDDLLARPGSVVRRVV